MTRLRHSRQRGRPVSAGSHLAGSDTVRRHAAHDRSGRHHRAAECAWVAGVPPPTRDLETTPASTTTWPAPGGTAAVSSRCFTGSPRPRRGWSACAAHRRGARRHGLWRRAARPSRSRQGLPPRGGRPDGFRPGVCAAPTVSPRSEGMWAHCLSKTPAPTWCAPERSWSTCTTHPPWWRRPAGCCAQEGCWWSTRSPRPASPTSSPSSSPSVSRSRAGRHPRSGPLRRPSGARHLLRQPRSEVGAQGSASRSGQSWRGGPPNGGTR